MRRHMLMVNSLFPGFRGRAKANGITGSPISMPMDECCLHEGGSYRAFYEKTGMAKDDTLCICFKTPPSGYLIQLKRIEWGSLNAGEFEVLEAPTWAAGTGSQADILQRNRRLPENSQLLENSTGPFMRTNCLMVDPTGIGGGKKIDSDSTIVKKTSAIIAIDDKEPLAVDTTYIFKITATVSDNTAKFKILWNEYRER